MRFVTVCFLVLVIASPALASVLDLTAGGSGSFGVDFFVTTDQQPTGTGVIMPFVRIQGNVEEDGFNTDFPPGSGDLDDVKAGSWTHSILVGSITPVLFNGELMLRFLLDINETSSKSLLSLDELRIFTAGSPNISTLAVLNAQNLVYDMGVGNKIYLDYNLNSGSGSGDLLLFLPASLFAGLDNQYLYLYSRFGASGGDYTSDDGFEEWSVIEEPVSVEPATWGAMKSIYRNQR